MGRRDTTAGKENSLMNGTVASRSRAKGGAAASPPAEKPARGTKRARNEAPEEAEEVSGRGGWGGSSVCVPMLDDASEHAGDALKQANEERDLAVEKFEEEERKCEAANHEISVLEKRVAELERDGGLTEKGQKLVNDKRKLANEVQQLKLENAKAATKIKSLTSQLEKEGKEAPAPRGRGRGGAKGKVNDEMEREREKHEDEREEWAKELAGWEKEVANWQDEVANLQKTLDSERAASCSQVAELKAALDASRASPSGEASDEASGKRRRTNSGGGGDPLRERLAGLKAQYESIPQRMSICSYDSVGSNDAPAAPVSNGGGGSSKEVAKVKKELKDVTNERDDLQELTKQQETMIADLEKSLQAANKARRTLHNTLQELKGSIRVYCRLRPTLACEEEQDNFKGEADFGMNSSGERPAISLTTQNQSAFARGGVPGKGQKRDAVNHNFEFDQIFGPSDTQEKIFQEVEGVVQSALDGYRVCIFAYGQTGSGKTHTMTGVKQDEGLIPRALSQICKEKEQMVSGGWNVELSCSCVEIYNEQIRDLLSDKDDDNGKHDILHDKASGEAMISNVRWISVSCVDTATQALNLASTRRETACTSRNAQSSRSHSVFQLRIKAVNSKLGEKREGVLNMVDLAGSERLGTDHQSSKVLKEAQNINKSLSSLVDVISAIALKHAHVPFRNSKLTHMLSPCLGKDSKTLMLANISPLMTHSAESLNTLRFAEKVNSCTLGPAKKLSASS